MDYTGAIWETTNQNQVYGAGAWSGNQITAASDADYGILLARQLIYLVAFKTFTIQFYYDAGNTFGSSLSPVPGAVYNFGLLDQGTFADLDGVLFFASQSKTDSSKIYMLENLQATPISTPEVERQLDLNILTSPTFYAYAYTHVGHSFYVITNTTTNVTMVYDIKEKLWYLWTDYLGNYYPVAARCNISGVEYQQMITTGELYPCAIDSTYPNDYGNIVPVDIYTPNFDAGVDRIKYLSQIRFNADQTNGSILWVRSSDDDFKTYNNFRRVDLSKERPFITDEGSFYRRTYHFRHYANTPLRLRSVDLQMDIGTL